MNPPLSLARARLLALTLSLVTASPRPAALRALRRLSFMFHFLGTLTALRFAARSHRAGLGVGLGCLGIDLTLGDSGERLVGGHFFLQRLIEQFDDAVMSQQGSERFRRPVGRDLVVFHALSIGDEAGVDHQILAILAHGFRAFFEKSDHAYALLPARTHLQRFKDLLQPSD